MLVKVGFPREWPRVRCYNSIPFLILRLHLTTTLAVYSFLFNNKVYEYWAPKSLRFRNNLRVMQDSSFIKAHDFFRPGKKVGIRTKKVHFLCNYLQAFTIQTINQSLGGNFGRQLHLSNLIQTPIVAVYYRMSHRFSQRKGMKGLDENNKRKFIWHFSCLIKLFFSLLHLLMASRLQFERHFSWYL